jgi:hypothetical protein
MAEAHRRSGATFDLFTTVPEWFFGESIAGGFRYHDVVVDVGFRQRSALEFDLPATVAALREHLPFDDRWVRRLARTVRAAGCTAVLCDIASLGVAVAEEAGLPFLLVENFTWPWLYEPLFAEVGARWVRSVSDSIGPPHGGIRAEERENDQPGNLDHLLTALEPVTEKRGNRRTAGFLGSHPKQFWNAHHPGDVVAQHPTHHHRESRDPLAISRSNQADEHKPAVVRSDGGERHDPGADAATREEVVVARVLALTRGCDADANEE